MENIKGIPETSANVPMHEVKIKKIVIGIPHMGLFHWNVLASLLSLQVPKGYKLQYHMVGSCLIYEAREGIVKYAQSVNAEYLLFLDSDMSLPHDALLKMVSHLENGVDNKPIDIICGTAFKRTAPFQPCFYTKLAYDTKTYMPQLESPVEFPKEGLLPLQGIGMACCMIKMSAFDKIKDKPYFFPLPNLGEDLTFCLKAKHSNVKIYCDLSIDVEHIATMPIKQEHYRACYSAYKESGSNKPLFVEGG
jgi:hypothetical protein